VRDQVEVSVSANLSALDAANTPSVIAFEKQPRWAPELQRQFLNETARVIACRSVKDVEERLAGVLRGVVLLDASATATDCLEFLKREMSDPAALPVVIVGNAKLVRLEWTFRELGAAAFFPKKSPGHEMASLCRRLWSCENALRLSRTDASRFHQGAFQQ
jgi:DNA-binding NtrC family response regulator